MKVQYPGAAEAIQADLANADLLGSIMTQLFRGLDPAQMVAEIQARIGEELDYGLEAANQQAFADFYVGHPFIHVPAVVDTLSTTRVLTTELATGAPWAELLTWDQHEKDLAAEAIFRFVFRSLYRFHAFNGDPHPGNYLFRPGGQVTFLDFGLVKHFDAHAMATFQSMIRYAVLEPDHAKFRAAVESAGLLRAGRAGQHGGGGPVLRALLRGRAGRHARSRGHRSTPRPPCARRSTATRPSPSTPRCRPTSSSSSASTSGCTPSSASCGPRPTTGRSPRSCGRWWTDRPRRRWARPRRCGWPLAPAPA